MDDSLRILNKEKRTGSQTYYHPAFVCGFQMHLYALRSSMEYKPEYPLSQEPQYVDLLVLKKDPTIKITSAIAEFFRGRNIIEYKGCGDDLNMLVIQKTIGYASMYYALQEKQASFSLNDMTACIFRNAFPRDLFKEFAEKGITLKRPHKASYIIKNAKGLK